MRFTDSIRDMASFLRTLWRDGHDVLSAESEGRSNPLPDKTAPAASNRESLAAGNDEDAWLSAHERRSEELPGTLEQETPYYRDPFTPPPKRSRFAILLDRALHPRWRKHARHNVVQTPTARGPRSHLQAVMEDFIMGGPDEFGYGFSPHGAGAGARAVATAGQVGVLLAVSAAQDAVDAVKRPFVERKMAQEREAKLAVRRKYYAAENERRQAAAAQIANAKPPPENPRPTPELLMEAYALRHESEEHARRFGRLMIDLEEHVKAKRQITGNRITGSSGGVRDWLKQNCPELAKHYDTCQRFKRKMQFDPLTPEDERNG